MHPGRLTSANPTAGLVDTSPYPRCAKGYQPGNVRAMPVARTRRWTGGLRQRSVHRVRETIAHAGQDVRVGVERDRDGGVPEHLLDQLGVLARLQQDRRCGVAEIVEPDAWQPRAVE
jgi:hypothetical protein